MKNNSLQSYKVQYRLKSELKTMNQIPLSPLRMSSLVVVHCTRDHLANIIAYLTLHFWVNIRIIWMAESFGEEDRRSGGVSLQWC